MTDRFQTEPLHTPPLAAPLPAVVNDQPELPAWLAERLLRPFEIITRVRGPRLSPDWEPLVTHPGLFLLALPLGAACVFVGSLIAGSLAALHPVAGLAALAVVVGSVFVVGICSGHFSRLVVTNQRLFIVQGRELCRSWDLDELPPHLIRHTLRTDGLQERSIDLDAVTAMLDGLSGKFTEAKSIVEFGKKLEQITLRKDKLP
jgi:hypothetical protein